MSTAESARRREAPPLRSATLDDMMLAIDSIDTLGQGGRLMEAPT